jgi:hypothetical protein
MEAPAEILETKALAGLRIDLAAPVSETRPMNPGKRRKR